MSVVDRRSLAGAGADVELAGMQRAFDHVPLEPAIGQQREGMAADVVGAEPLTLDPVEREAWPPASTGFASPSATSPVAATLIQSSAMPAPALVAPAMEPCGGRGVQWTGALS